jgi:preprotein translocase subunit SecB
MSENETPADSSAENTEAQSQQERPQAGFAMERVYVKDVSFESPNSPDVFMQPWKPKVVMDLNTKHKLVRDNVHEVAVTITLTVKVEEKTAYILEVQQAALFVIQGIEGMQLHHTLGVVCPNLIFPYLRESIDNVLAKGSFQPMMLAPVNFEAIFAQALEKKKQEMAQASEEAQDSTSH